MSKVFEALNEIKTLKGFNKTELGNDKNITKSLHIIEQALLNQLSGSQYTNIFIDEAVKSTETIEQKILSIIWEKQVDIMWFDMCIKSNKNFEDYNSGMGRELEYLTEEEFNLLRRWNEQWHLKNQN